MKVAIHQPNYLPWMGVILKVSEADVFVFLDDAQYSNQGGHNRNLVKGASGAIRLTVPVRQHLGDRILDVVSCDTAAWNRKHLATIEQCYRHARHFAEAFALMELLLARRYENLAELNMAILRAWCGQLGLTTRFVRASELDIHTKREQRVLDICEHLGADVYLSGNGARAYQVESHFAERGIELRYQRVPQLVYPQLWGEFVPNLSALDYFMNCGFELGGAGIALGEAGEMNILFLTIGTLPGLDAREIYPDLLRELVRRGHRVHVVRTLSQPERWMDSPGASCQDVLLPGIRGDCPQVRKGLAYLLLPLFNLRALRGAGRFDLLLLSTPPVSYARVVEAMKRRQPGLACYLLQKDFFPQDALDLGVLSKTGVRGLPYRFFRWQERRLYEACDFIGTMSKACSDHLLRANPGLPASKVHENPNSIEVSETIYSEAERAAMRREYGLPGDKVIFVYGGNLSSAQGVDFIRRALDAARSTPGALFLLMGSGGGFELLRGKLGGTAGIEFREPLAPGAYHRLVGCCDVGLVFLNSRLTVPNIPSRILFYLDHALPVISATDSASDLNSMVLEHGFGIAMHSTDQDVNTFAHAVATLCASAPLRHDMGSAGKRFLREHWSARRSAQILFDHVCGKEGKPNG